jgi:hypothetical protein
MKTFLVVASQNQTVEYEIEVKAKNEVEAEKIALKKDINSWYEKDPWNNTDLEINYVDQIEEDE